MRSLLNVAIVMMAAVSMSGCCAVMNGSCETMSSDCGVAGSYANCDDGCGSGCGDCNSTSDCCSRFGGGIMARRGMRDGGGLGLARGCDDGCGVAANCDDCSTPSGPLNGVYCADGTDGCGDGWVRGRMGLRGMPSLNNGRSISGLFSGLAAPMSRCSSGACGTDCGSCGGGGLRSSFGDTGCNDGSCGPTGLGMRRGGLGLRGGMGMGAGQACGNCAGAGCQSCGIMQGGMGLRNAGGMGLRGARCAGNCGGTCQDCSTRSGGLGAGGIGGGMSAFGDRLHPYGGQVPHTAQAPNMNMAPTYNYPYYTTRGPRDFLMANPPSIGW